MRNSPQDLKKLRKAKDEDTGKRRTQIEREERLIKELVSGLTHLMGPAFELQLVRRDTCLKH